VEGSGRSGIDGVFADEAEALERARYLLTLARYNMVRVARVNAAGREEEIFAKTCAGGGEKAPTISAVETSEPCADVWAVYGRASRATLLRLLRAYWDDQVSIPAETLHRHIPLRMLEREATLFNPALSRLATLQAPSLGIPVFTRQDQLTALFEQIKGLARDDKAPVDADKALATSGVPGLLDALSAHPPEGRDRVVTHAFSRLLDPHRDWNGKLDAVLDLLVGSRSDSARVVDDTPDTARIVDEMLAEIVDGREPIRSLIGYAPNLAAAVASIIAVADGRLDDRLPGTPTAMRLSDAIAGAPLPLTREALFERLAGALDSSAPLSRASPTEENALFGALLDRLKTADGWRGGPGTAVALTRRAKIVGRAGSDDLSFEAAVDRLCGALSAPSARIAYLLDLAATPFGRSRVSVLIDRVGAALAHVSTIAETAPPGTPPHAARRSLERRLGAAGVPRAAADALIRRVAGIPDNADAITLVRTANAKLVLHVGDKARDVPRDGTEFVLGRERACDARLEEPSVSRRHAKIVFHDGRYHLTDTSRNGTTVILADGRTIYLASGETLPLTDAAGEIRVVPDEEGPPRVRVTWRLTPE